MGSTSATVSPKVGRSLLALLVASVVVAAMPAVGRAGSEPVTALKATADADTYVSASRPTRAYGSSSLLRVDGTGRRAYVRFNVGGVTGAVVKATLRLYVLDGSRRGVDLRLVPDDSWDEGMTFANAPAAAPGVTASSGALASRTWLSLDVTPIVRRDGKYAFALTSRSTSDVEFAARERGLATSPQLIVEQVLTDSTPPSRPVGLGAPSITKTDATISWAAATDGESAVSYDLYRGGTKIGTTSGTSYELTGLACGTTYSVTVAARDTAGNVSAPATLTFATAPCTESVSRDTVAPGAPTLPLVTEATRTTITLAWSAATDNVGIAGYELYQGGSSVGRTTATTYTFTGLGCSTSYTLGVRAYDGAGNQSEVLTVVAATALCPDTTAPTPPSLVTTSGATETTISLVWGASLDNTGVTGYGVYRGGALIGSAPLATYMFGGLECGTSYTLGVDAYDAAGNRSAVSSITAATSPCPDRQPPAVSLTNPAPAEVVPSSSDPACKDGRIPVATCVLLNVAASDNVGVTAVRYYVDGAEVAADVTCCDWSEDWDASTATDGEHGLTAKAWDAAGNVGASATVTFTVENAAPPPPTAAPPPPPPAPSGATYYVSSAGSDTNSGLSASTPWRTLAKVNAAALSPGDAVLFKAGETWSGVLAITRSGSSSARITLDAYGTGVAPVFTGGNGDRCVELRGAFLAFRNLRVDGCKYGLAIFGHDALVERATFTNNAEGLRVEPGSLRARVAFCDFRDNNKMVVNTPGGDDDYGAMGMLVGGDDVEAHHNTFSGHSAASYDYGHDGAAIEVFGGQRGRYHHNLSVDNITFSELGDARSADNAYAYNVVRASIANASFLETRGAGSFGPVYRTYAYNNSVWLTGPASPGIWCGNCAVSILKLRNNAIKVTDGYAIAGADEDYNIFAGSYLNGTLGPHSRRADPLFLSSTDLHLQPTSPAVDTGLDLGALVDFEGVAVPTGLAPDMGAYELRR